MVTGYDSRKVDSIDEMIQAVDDFAGALGDGDLEIDVLKIHDEEVFAR